MVGCPASPVHSPRPSTIVPHRIAFCITTLEPGGAERQMVELATRLPSERWEPRLFVLGTEPPPTKRTLAKLAHDRGLPVEYLGASGLWSALRTVGRLASRLRKFRPAVLQCFLAHANVAGALAARRACVPHVLTGIRVADRRHNWHALAARQTDRYVERHVCVS